MLQCEQLLKSKIVYGRLLELANVTDSITSLYRIAKSMKRLRPLALFAEIKLNQRQETLELSSPPERPTLKLPKVSQMPIKLRHLWKLRLELSFATIFRQYILIELRFIFIN